MRIRQLVPPSLVLLASAASVAGAAGLPHGSFAGHGKQVRSGPDPTYFLGGPAQISLKLQGQFISHLTISLSSALCQNSDSGAALAYKPAPQLSGFPKLPLSGAGLQAQYQRVGNGPWKPVQTVHGAPGSVFVALNFQLRRGRHPAFVGFPRSLIVEYSADADGKPTSNTQAAMDCSVINDVTLTKK